MATPVLPVAAEDRLSLLDGLRGFALCGILVANILGFSGFGFIVVGMPDPESHLGPGVAAVRFFTEVFVIGKFYSIFSFLFGLGFAVQLSRGEGRPDWLRVYVRRLRILLLIGLAHALLLWYGDILWIYALLGMALLPFSRFSSRALLRWSIALLLAPIPLYVIYLVIAPGFDTDRLIPDAMSLEQIIPLYAGASYPVYLGLNLEDVQFRIKELFLTGRWFKILGMFVLGIWVGRTGILHNPVPHRPLLVRTLVIASVVGLSASVVHAFLPSSFVITRGELYRSVTYALGVHPLAVAYIAGFTLLWQTGAGQRLLSPLVPMGRMALSNYLMQSLIAVLIYKGFGLGWHGRMPILVTMLVVLPAILLAQMIISSLWLRHFRYGPAEWAWRQATYRRSLPIRRSRGEEAAAAAPRP